MELSGACMEMLTYQTGGPTACALGGGVCEHAPVGMRRAIISFGGRPELSGRSRERALVEHALGALARMGSVGCLAMCERERQSEKRERETVSMCILDGRKLYLGAG